MAKRILLLLLCVALLLPAFSLQVWGETEQTEETVSAEETEPSVLDSLRAMREQTYPYNEAYRIRRQILDTHITTLERTGHDSLGGFCGLQVSWELYLLGINRAVIGQHGKDHYDFYKTLDTTSGGYTVLKYSADKYSIMDALNLITKNGTVNAYNIMLCFEKTDTEAGAQYGHVSFIHAVLDGMVYGVEGFGTHFGTIEGEPIVVPMEQYAKWYEDWAEFEGLIYFGTKSAVDSCTYYPADLFLECGASLPVVTLPDEERGQLLRQTTLGERLHATGLYENLYGQRYYRILDDEGMAYVPAHKLTPILFLTESIQYEKPVLPTLLKVGERFKIGGTVRSELLPMENLRLVITDSDGKDQITVPLMESGNECKLGNYMLQKLVNTATLEAGVYTYSILADVKNYYLQDDEYLFESQTACVVSTWFGVGISELPEQPIVQVKGNPHGWVYEQGKWYYYENGEPKIGWLGYKGNDYYLDETGAALTGWVLINGKQRYFSHTGCMRTGWMHTEEGTFYLLRNGVAATGWRNVDGSRYCFDDDGKMRSGGWTELDGRLYYLDAEGKAATGWVRMETGIYSFHVDGYLLAKREEQDGKLQIITYDGTWKPY